MDSALIVEIERQVLQAMCQGTAEGSVLELGKRTLVRYRWREFLHQVIFEVLAGLPGDFPGVIREQLPARLTRKGFPDVSWEDFFRPHALAKQEVERRMRQLADLV